MTLENEIEKAQRQVRTDSYQMSIGEVVSLYERDELIIRPPFQRLFRWELTQKAKLIESILLGIPIPPIFVFETDKGVWELIDGLQRVSTILEFLGILKNEKNGKLRPPSCLSGTRYLPSLDNAVWEKSPLIQDVPEDEQQALGREQQFFFKRSKMNVQILKRPSDAETKYDLFQRLNRGGTIANAQEVRNCVVLMINEKFFESVRALVDDANFADIIRVKEHGEQTQRPLELAMRFLVFLNFDYDEKLDVEEFVDDRIIKLAENPPKGWEQKFRQTFELLNAVFGHDALRRWNPLTKKFSGRVGLVALEVVAVGIARNIAAIERMDDKKGFVKKRVLDFWARPEVEGFTAAGVRGTERLKKTIRFGNRWFRP